MKSNVLFQSRFSRQQLTTILTLKLWSRDRAHGMTQAHVVLQLAALGKGLRTLLTAERFRLLLVGGNFSSPFEDFVVSSEHVVTNFGPVIKAGVYIVYFEHCPFPPTSDHGTYIRR